MAEEKEEGTVAVAVCATTLFAFNFENTEDTNPPAAAAGEVEKILVTAAAAVDTTE